MKACIVGAGPAGLYAAKALRKNGIPVNIYEKLSEALGNYKYADTTKVNFDLTNVHYNTDHTKIPDCKCDFYIVATGGIPKTLPNTLQGMDIVKAHFDGTLGYLGDKVCIIGMGNVAMDIIKYIKDKCKDITVLSKTSLYKAPFDNHKIKEVIEALPTQSEYESNTQNEDTDTGDRKTRRRIEIFKNMHKAVKEGVAKLKLIFGANLKSITREGEKTAVVFEKGLKYHKEVFDNVISSIGFIPNPVKIDTQKPVYYLGWSKESRGNINDSRIEAEDLVESIISNGI